MATETRIIKLEVRSAGAARTLRSMDRNLERTRRSAVSLESAFNKLNRLFGIFALAGAGGAAIRGVVQLSDQYQELSARVNLVARNTVGMDQAMGDLADTARTTFTTLEGTAALYSRLGIATKDLGLGHEDLLGITQLVADTLRLSGASAKESAAFMTQFSQAMASGRFAGDEFRSMLESNVFLSNLLAEALDTNVGGLREMAEAGKLTTDVVLRALLPAVEEVREEASDLPVTLSRAMTNLRTSFQEMIGQGNELIPVLSGLASAVNLLAEGFAALADFIRVVNSLFDSGLDNQSKYNLLQTQRLQLLDDIAAKERSIADLREEEFVSINKIRLQEAALNGLNVQLGKVEAQIKKMADKRAATQFTDPASLLGGGDGGGGDGGQEQKQKLETLRIAAERIIPLYAQELDNYADSLGRAADAETLTAEKTKILINSFFALGLSAEQLREEFGRLYPEINLGGEAAEEAISWTDALSTALGQTLASATSTAADAIVDFAVRGEQSFGDMAQSILESIAKMIIQMAIMRSLFGATGTGGLVGGLFPQATGNAFQGGNVVPFARGGVVTSPTIFPMANGTGLMGEAGAEAIIPLSRGRDGKLGVSGGATVVNINNSTGEPATTETTTGPNGEEMINVFIGAVARDMASGGSTAKAVEQSYGLRRAGNMR